MVTVTSPILSSILMLRVVTTDSFEPVLINGEFGGRPEVGELVAELPSFVPSNSAFSSSVTRLVAILSIYFYVSCRMLR